ncbi:MAG: hypothetical protein WDW36_001049 [Sanguina aurantia]
MSAAQARCYDLIPTLGISAAREAAVVVSLILVNELLYTGILFAAPARWVTDRMYEAGAGEDISMPFNILGAHHTLLLTTLQAGQWLVTALYALVVAAGVTQQARTSIANMFTEGDGRGGPSSSQQTLGGSSHNSSSSSSSSKASTNVASTTATGLGGSVRATPTTALPRGDPSGVQSVVCWVTRTQEMTRLLTIHTIFIMTGGNLAATLVTMSTELLTLNYLKCAAMRASVRRQLD